tara:strand:- start:703 stop:1056 length:354 start_codon:yes stop_codon:yes gene_type:complete
MSCDFKKNNTFLKRHQEAMKIKQQYSDRIPIIVYKNPTDISTPNLEKTKYLVPNDLTVGQFVFVIRKRIELSPEKALFIFINNILPPTSSLMSSIYEENADDDGFLYVVYCGENTFG